jgi:hypothetical protein
MTAPGISQFELADPAPAGQPIPAPAAARTAAGQSLSWPFRRPAAGVRRDARVRGGRAGGLPLRPIAFASGASWLVTDPRPSRGFTVFLPWGHCGMPLLFLISGMGARYAMRTRSAAAFARARLARLSVPFAFGPVLLVPPMFYIEALGRMAPSGSCTGATPAAAPTGSATCSETSPAGRPSPISNATSST